MVNSPIAKHQTAAAFEAEEFTGGNPVGATNFGRKFQIAGNPLGKGEFKQSAILCAASKNTHKTPGYH